MTKLQKNIQPSHKKNPALQNISSHFSSFAGHFMNFWIWIRIPNPDTVRTQRTKILGDPQHWFQSGT
jgi:hypothetical protein